MHFHSSSKTGGSSAESVTSADLAAAKASAQELGNISTAAKASADTQVKAGEDVEQVEAKAFTSKQQLRQAVKGLAMEFPILATLGRMAINPITAAVALATGAWAIWKARIDATVQSLGGVEMPDVGDSWTKAPREAGKAWKEYGDAIRTIIATYHEADAASARMLAALKAETDMRLASIKAIKDYAEAKLEAEKASSPAGEYARRKGDLGAAAGKAESDTKWEGEQAEWYAKNERIVALNQEAAAKEAQAKKIHVGEAGDYTNAEADSKKLADAAAENIKKSKAWVAEMERYKDGVGNFFERRITAFKLGLSSTGATLPQTPEEKIDVFIPREQENQRGWRVDLSSNSLFQRAQRVREEARTRRKGLLDEAATARGAAYTGDQDLGDQAGALAGKHVGDLRNQALVALAEVYRALADITKQLKELQDSIVKDAQASHAVMATTIKRVDELTKEKNELEQRARSMEGRTPRV